MSTHKEENPGEANMGTENLNNRSTAMTPELIAMINASTSAAVKEAVAGMAVIMAQTIKDLAITPEKLREANRPFVDPVKERREIREKMKFREDEAQQAIEKRQQKENCRHFYPNNLCAISVVRNFFDRNPRGICMLCQDWLNPREWVIDAPSEEFPRGKSHIVEAHKDYKLVLQAIQKNG
jgi:hypothetical protein